MKHLLKHLLLCLLSAAALRLPAQNNVIDTASRAKVFAPGVVSTPYAEWATSFTPDGKTVYFSQGSVYWTVVSSTQTNGKWSKPAVADFSGRWSDTDPFVSPDGKRLFFISNRPLDNIPGNKAQKDYHLWYVDLMTSGDWGTPRHLDSPINLPGVNVYAPSVSGAGMLYFCSRDRREHKGIASYAARRVGDHYEQPVLLSLNGNEETQDPFISPDETYILFVSGNDLYISYRDGNHWTAAQKLGPEVNNGDSNSSPCVSPDGKTLYYSSGRIHGFYKRETGQGLDYDGLVKEMQNIYNGFPNILMIPISIATSKG